MKRISLTILFLIVNIGCWSQQKKNVEDFNLKDVRDNKEYSLESFAGSKAIALIFTSTVCAYSVYYDERIKKLIATYSSKGISFALINSNFGRSSSAENLDKLKLHARNFEVPYLADIAQDAMSKIGARKNPEVFLLRKEAGKFHIVYQGAIDDNPQVASDVHENYFETALNQFLENQNVTPGFVNPAGCIIKKM